MLWIYRLFSTCLIWLDDYVPSCACTMLGDVELMYPFLLVFCCTASLLLSLFVVTSNFEAILMFPGVSRFSLLLFIVERKNGISFTFQGMGQGEAVSDLRK